MGATLGDAEEATTRARSELMLAYTHAEDAQTLQAEISSDREKVTVQRAVRWVLMFGPKRNRWSYLAVAVFYSLSLLTLLVFLPPEEWTFTSEELEADPWLVAPWWEDLITALAAVAVLWLIFGVLISLLERHRRPLGQHVGETIDLQAGPAAPHGRIPARAPPPPTGEKVAP